MFAASESHLARSESRLASPVPHLMKSRSQLPGWNPSSPGRNSVGGRGIRVRRRGTDGACGHRAGTWLPARVSSDDGRPTEGAADSRPNSRWCSTRLTVVKRSPPGGGAFASRWVQQRRRGPWARRDSRYRALGGPEDPARTARRAARHHPLGAPEDIELLAHPGERVGCATSIARRQSCRQRLTGPVDKPGTTETHGRQRPSARLPA